jgi:ubiquinone/menaquinone biosynthesis C-methylase UbiE
VAESTRPIRLANVACGFGWAAIELAKAYPGVRVDGYDSDEASIRRARKNAADHGVTDPVTFTVVNAPLMSRLRCYRSCPHDPPPPGLLIAAITRPWC